MKLDAKALGLSCGIIWALALLILGITAMNGFGSEFVSLLGSMYVGYEATLLGAVVGGIWGFADAFVGGWVLAVLYNKLAK
ncbi:bacteriophage holin [Candidatus Peregrinibacteria bacterium]|jgi:hypothetical protein|nr:bacteriophage holin [Candidatus Peregrinibacteria bacterium]MBT5468579.1 bacteriophage holin [Candidatus Peregrinibacteria bacterium]MBT7337619.1 bacteriophage holin [Candidatus Peregrinibacteria bacterium]